MAILHKLEGIVVLAGLLMASAAAAEGGDDPTEKARVFFEKGSQYFAQGKYDDAVRELKAAYDLSQNPVLLYNIAKCYDKLGKFTEAIRYYRDYLDKAKEISEEDRKDVERTIRLVEKRQQELLPELVIRSTPTGADIYLDGKTKIVGQTPARFRVDAGPHKIYLEKKGYEPVEKDFLMPTGQPLVLEFDMKKIEEYGYIQVVANVAGARVFIDGKNVGITPYGEVPSVRVGRHQIILEKDGYRRFITFVEVARGRTSLVNVELTPIEAPSTWPSALGWTGVVVGALSLAASFGATWFANQQFNDTSLFHDLSVAERATRIGGGGLLAVGFSLLIYGAVQEPPREDVVVPAGEPAAFDTTAGPVSGALGPVPDAATALPVLLRPALIPGGVR